MRKSQLIRPRSVRRVHIANETETGGYVESQVLSQPEILQAEIDRRFRWRESSLIKIIRGMVRQVCECETDTSTGAGTEYNECAPDMNVLATSETVINWQTADITSSYIPHALGFFTPRRAGLYSVHIWFYDEFENTSSTQELRIYGNGASNTQARAIYSGTTVNLYGSKLVYCNGTTDTIYATIYNASAGALTYNSITGARHVSYIHINYEGNDSTIGV